MSTGIEWTDETWNPIVGCTHVSPGCDHCYAAREASGRLARTPTYAGLAVAGRFTGEVRLLPDRLDQPLRWRRPRRVFVNSMSDLFHDAVPDEYLCQVFDTMLNADQHIYQVLTKRHARMRAFVTRYLTGGYATEPLDQAPLAYTVDQPPPHIWLGVSVETQQWADIRVPALLDTPAAVRWISAEPLLGPVRLDPLWLYDGAAGWPPVRRADGLDWVVTGGESGPGARPMHPDWARALRDQCQESAVPFLFKQWGEWQHGSAVEGRDHVVLADGRHYPASEYWASGQAKADDRDRSIVTATMMARVGKHRAGRDLDGRIWDEYPAGAP